LKQSGVLLPKEKNVSERFRVSIRPKREFAIPPHPARRVGKVGGGIGSDLSIPMMINVADPLGRRALL